MTVVLTAPDTAAPSRPVAGVARRGVRWVLRRAGDVALLVAVLAFLGLAVGPHVAGYRTMTMLTSSMAPLIEPGDVVVTTAIPVTEIEPGMVLTYQIPVGDRRVVSHRVLAVETAVDGSVSIRTQGDAADGPDPWTATLAGDTAWQVRAVVPVVGDVIRLLQTPGLRQALVWGAPALVAGWVLLSVWRPARTDDDAGASESDSETGTGTARGGPA